MGFGQVIRRIRRCGCELGSAQLEQHLAQERRLRGLGERAAQQGGGGRRRAALASALGGESQLGDDVRITGRRRVEQLQRNPLRRGAAGAEQIGGARMRGGTVVGREPRSHGRGEDRMAEAHRRRVVEKPGPHEIGGGGGCPLDGQSRELGCRVERDAVPQHRRRPGQRRRLRAQPRQRRRDGARHRGRGDLGDALGARGREGDAVGTQRPYQLPEQERVAARGVVARARERLVDGPVLPQQSPDAVEPERRRLDPRRGRVLADRRECTLLRGAGRDQQRDRERLHAPGDVREEAQRGLVGPVRVVDHEQHRCLLGKVGDQPVEAVENPDRGGLERLRDVEQDRSGQPGRSPQEPLTIGLRPDAGSRHWRATPSGYSRSSSVPRPWSTRIPLSAAALARRGQQARLADARRPLDQQHRPRPRACLGEQPLEGRQLLIALDQCHRPTLIAATAKSRSEPCRSTARGPGRG